MSQLLGNASFFFDCLLLGVIVRDINQRFFSLKSLEQAQWLVATSWLLQLRDKTQVRAQLSSRSYRCTWLLILIFDVEGLNIRPLLILTRWQYADRVWSKLNFLLVKAFL